MREQLFELHKSAAENEYSLDGVFLTHAHIGHYTGLMHFGREAVGAKGIPVYAMPMMAEYLSNNGPWDQQLVRLNNIELMPLTNGAAVELNTHLAVTPFQVPHRKEYSETVGYRIDGSEQVGGIHSGHR